MALQAACRAGPCVCTCSACGLQSSNCSCFLCLIKVWFMPQIHPPHNMRGEMHAAPLWRCCLCLHRCSVRPAHSAVSGCPWSALCSAAFSGGKPWTSCLQRLLAPGRTFLQRWQFAAGEGGPLEDRVELCSTLQSPKGGVVKRAPQQEYLAPAWRQGLLESAGGGTTHGVPTANPSVLFGAPHDRQAK